MYWEPATLRRQSRTTGKTLYTPMQMQLCTPAEALGKRACMSRTQTICILPSAIDGKLSWAQHECAVSVRETTTGTEAITHIALLVTTPGLAVPRLHTIAARRCITALAVTQKYNRTV